MYYGSGTGGRCCSAYALIRWQHFCVAALGKSVCCDKPVCYVLFAIDLMCKNRDSIFFNSYVLWIRIWWALLHMHWADAVCALIRWQYFCVAALGKSVAYDRCSNSNIW